MTSRFGSADADEAALDEDDERVEHDPQQGDREQGGEQQRDVEEAAAGEVHEDAEARVGAGPLAHDRADDGERDADAEAAEDRRQGRRDLERRRGPGGASPAGCGRARAGRASTARMPTIVAIATGKKTISAQMTTLAVRPGPNHSASSGARARIGVAWAATR